MSARGVNIDALINFVHVVSTAFTVLIYLLTIPDTSLTWQFTASLFMSTNFVVVYLLKSLLPSYKATSRRIVRYIATISERALDVLDEVVAVAIVLVVGYIIAFVFAGVRDPVVYLAGITSGILYRYVLVRTLPLLVKRLGGKLSRVYLATLVSLLYVPVEVSITLPFLLLVLYVK